MRELGVFPWLAVGLAALAWRTRPETRIRETVTIVALYALLAGASYASVVAFGMEPRLGPTLAVAALHVSVVAVMLHASRLVGAACDARTSRLPRWARVVVRTVLADVLVFGALVPALAMSLALHRAPGSLPLPSRPLGLESRRLALRSADGTRIDGVWLSHPRAAGAVLLVHGLGAEKVQFLAAADGFVSRGFSVLAIDLRDHGASSGLSSTLGLLESEDVRAAWAELLASTRDRDMPRVLFGISLGGAAVNLAAPSLEHVDGIVLDSTFADVGHIARRWLPLPEGLRDPTLLLARAFALPVVGYPVLDVVPAAAARDNRGTYPVLVFHSRRDPMIPFSEAEALVAAYGKRARLVAFDDVSHPNAHLYAPVAYDRAIGELCDAIARARNATPGQ